VLFACIRFTFLDTSGEDYLNINGYKDLLRIVFKRPRSLNVLRALAYSIIRLRPALRQLTIFVGLKIKEPMERVIER